MTAYLGPLVLIGGLTSNNTSTNTSSTPGLREMPILGRLFGFSSQTEERQDLLILITPHIIDDLVTPSTSTSN